MIVYETIGNFTVPGGFLPLERPMADRRASSYLLRLSAAAIWGS